MHNLASCLQRMGRYRDSEALYRQALTIMEATLPETDISIATSQCILSVVCVCCVAVQKLADCLMSQMKLEDTESLFRRAMRISATSEDHELKALGEVAV